MEPSKTTTTVQIASWVLFLAALAMAAAWSFVLVSAEMSFGMSQVVAAGPLPVVVVIYLIVMPVIYGAIGLFRSSAKRRFIAAGAIALTALVYLLFIIFVASRV